MFGWFTKKKPKLSPGEKITATELGRLVFASAGEPPPRYAFYDTPTYQLVKLDEFRQALFTDDTDSASYRKNVYTCGKFAFRLMGNFSNELWGGRTVGIMWSTTHAFNFMIDTDKKVWVVEPQDDRLILLDRARKPYKPVHMIII